MALKQQVFQFLRQNWPVVGILCAALVAATWVGASMLLDFIYFNDPANQDLALKPWMTPKYVVLSYDLPQPLVADLLGLTSEDQRGMPMRDIADIMGVTLDELTDIVRAGAAEYRESSQ